MSIRQTRPASATIVRLSWSALVLATLVASPGLRAVEVLTVHELVSHCEFLEAEPDGADAQYCIRYIQGFIDGAAATDVRVMINVEDDPESSESFTERAKRTRAPTRADQFRAARLAGFCLGDPLPLKEVVHRVVADLIVIDVDDTANSPAREAVYASLRDLFPCPNE
jgi:hypothetical protein